MILGQNVQGDPEKVNFSPSEEQYEILFKNIKLIKEKASQNNIAFLMTAYPYLSHLKGKSSTESFSKLESWAKGNDILFLNTLERFQKENPRTIFFKHDYHGNNKFHQIMASEIYQALLENNFLPK